MSDNRNSNNNNSNRWANVIVCGAAAAAGFALAWLVKSDGSPSLENSYHTQPTRNFQDVPPHHDPTCAICLEKHDVVMLPCEHSFNATCIRDWFQQTLRESGRMICPTCRFAIPQKMHDEYSKRLLMD